MTLAATLHLTDAEAAAALRAERTRLTGRLMAAKRAHREAAAEIETVERRLAEVAEGEQILAGRHRGR